tara:strand:+ start:1824 stop:2132 length:309 start_codon:yes stop_codon:yes gene_type:complete
MSLIQKRSFDFSIFQGFSLWGFATTGNNCSEQEDVARWLTYHPLGWEEGSGPEASGREYRAAVRFMTDEGFLKVTNGTIRGTPRLWHLLQSHALRPGGELAG